MMLLRAGIWIGVLGWWFLLLDNEPLESRPLYLPIVAVLCYGVYVVLAMWKGGIPLWPETALIGTLIPFVVIAAAVTGGSLIYGGLRYGRTYLGQRRAG